MTIGPSTKKIAESIKNINNSQKESNNASILTEQPSKAAKFISKNTTRDVRPIKKLSAKEFNNSDGDEIITASPYSSLLEKLKTAKTNLVALDKKSKQVHSEKAIDKFLRERLPSLTSISVVYDYHDKFTTEKPQEKWLFNFNFFDDPKGEYVPYDPITMSSRSFNNKSPFSEYFDDTGKFILAEAFINEAANAMSNYEADAENVLVITSADLKENPQVLSHYNDITSSLSDPLKKSKYIFWGTPVDVKNMASTKAEWKQNTFDKLELVKEDKDILRDSYRNNPEKGYTTFVGKNNKSNAIQVVPDFIKWLEYTKENNVGTHKLAKTHIGALSADGLAAANRAVGNLTIENTTYASFKTGDTGNWETENCYKYGNVFKSNYWDVDWGKWGGPSHIGAGFIGDVIYKMYQNASNNDILSTSFGRVVNKAHRDGVSTKSELDLQTIPSYDLVNITIDRKLHVATCIGYTTYLKNGSRTTGYITSSSETIPASTAHNLFGIGRLASMAKIIKAQENDRKYNNSAIQNMIASGPDFMADMFDAYIISYTVPNNSTAIAKEADIIGLATPSTVMNAFMKDKNFKPNNEAVFDGLSSSTKSMFRTRQDFYTRVSSITIPTLEAETIEYSFLNQKYTIPGYRTQQEFQSAISFELDSGLEYMRLINRMAGFYNRYFIGGNVSKSLNQQAYRPLRTRIDNQKIGILVKLLPGNAFYNPYDNFKRYIIFEDVLFTGGGDASFSQKGGTGITTTTFKFIYKNLALGDLPIKDPIVSVDSNGVLKHTTEANYMPAIQMYGNTDIYKDIKSKSDKIGVDVTSITTRDEIKYEPIVWDS